MAKSTRSSTEDPIFGQFLQKLPENQLPLEIEVVRHYLHFKDTEFDQSYTREGKVVKVINTNTKRKIINKISTSLKDVWWSKGSIPVKSDRAIENTIENVIDKALQKCPKDFSKFMDGRNDQNLKMEFLKNKGFFKLVDISLCQCFVKATEEKDFNISKCSCKSKFPERELPFYCEQKLHSRNWFR